MRKYDLVASLGANCSAAHNLRYRGMRPYSLPLDWVYIEDDKPMKWLVGAFETKFVDFFQYENLKLLPPTSEHDVIYQDSVSGFIFPNHFQTHMQNKKDYDIVAAKMKRRVHRLFEKINSANKILFIIASSRKLDLDNIVAQKNKLQSLYPDKQFDFEVMMFDCEYDTDKIISGVHVNTFARKMNLYDFNKTNYEWAFLDDIEIRDKQHVKTGRTLLSVKLFQRKLKVELI